MTRDPKVKPIPEGMRSVTLHLVCAGAADAIEFYKKAFGGCGRRGRVRRARGEGRSEGYDAGRRHVLG